MNLSGKQKRHLRKLAHSLKPVVFVGQKGLGNSVCENIDQSLKAHELIKVKFVDCKDEKKRIGEEIEKKTGAVVVGSIGHILIIFRQNKKAEDRKIEFPE